MINKLLGIQPSETVGAVLARHRGIGPGFDLMRILLALYIFYGHALWLAGGENSVAGIMGLEPVGHAVAATAKAASETALAVSGYVGWTRPFHVAAVPVFFALSGFLVMGSALRLGAVSTFLSFRFLRIFPALVVETMLCAVGLGAMLTTFSAADYFSDPLFVRYLGNIAGFVSFHLPGLFEGNPVKGIVNANLWTLPAEFYCYLILALLMFTRLAYHRAAFTALYFLFALGFGGLSLTTGFGVTTGHYPPAAITFYFFTGVLLFHWRDRIPAHWALFLGAAMLSYALLLTRWSVFIAPLPVTYCTVFFGLVAIPKLPLISRGDYSYGIYLYGFPICQALVAAFPAVFVGHRYLLLGTAGVLTCLFAAFSWHCIESHTLALKRHLPQRWFPTPKRILPQTPEAREQIEGASRPEGPDREPASARA